MTISTQELKAQTLALFRVYSSLIITLQLKAPRTAEALGQLVVLGFDVAVFTPAPYQRHRL